MNGGGWSKDAENTSGRGDIPRDGSEETSKPRKKEGETKKVGRSWDWHLPIHLANLEVYISSCFQAFKIKEAHSPGAIWISSLIFSLLCISPGTNQQKSSFCFEASGNSPKPKANSFHESTASIARCTYMHTFVAGIWFFLLLLFYSCLP